MTRSTEKTVQEIPLGISLVEDRNGFILHRRRANGGISAINLTEEEFWELRGTIVFWVDRILSQRHAPWSGFETIIVQSVARARVLPDTMRESVLLTVAAPTGEQMTLELPPHVAKFIADQVPNVLNEMTTGTWH
jgi:hypothetical protein